MSSTNQVMNDFSCSHRMMDYTEITHMRSLNVAQKSINHEAVSQWPIFCQETFLINHLQLACVLKWKWQSVHAVVFYKSCHRIFDRMDCICKNLHISNYNSQKWYWVIRCIEETVILKLIAGWEKCILWPKIYLFTLELKTSNYYFMYFCISPNFGYYDLVAWWCK